MLYQIASSCWQKTLSNVDLTLDFYITSLSNNLEKTTFIKSSVIQRAKLDLY